MSEILVVVRRDAVDRLEALRIAFQGEPVQFIWDRRVRERRRALQPVAAERRRLDRRRAPPVTWTALDFVMVNGAATRVTM